MRVLTRWLLGAALLLAASQARVAGATPLNLQLPDFPDLLSQFIDIEFSAGSGAFTAHGSALELGVGPGVTQSILDGTFDIRITTDGMAAAGVPGDDLSIVGGLDETGDGVADLTGTLLTGEITRLGASSSGPGIFEFEFAVTGGLLTAAGKSFAVPSVGVILGANGNSTYAGSFAVDFRNNGGVAGAGAGSADTAPIPEPGTLLLLGAGFGGLVGFGRRRVRR